MGVIQWDGHGDMDVTIAIKVILLFHLLLWHEYWERFVESGGGEVRPASIATNKHWVDCRRYLDIITVAVDTVAVDAIGVDTICIPVTTLVVTGLMLDVLLLLLELRMGVIPSGGYPIRHLLYVWHGHRWGAHHMHLRVHGCSIGIGMVVCGCLVREGGHGYIL